MRGYVCALATVATLITSAAGVARAQSNAPEIGDAGHLGISVENLFGYMHVSETTSVSGSTLGDNKASDDVVSLFGSPVAGAQSIFTFPRVAFDVFATRGLSVGASLSVFHISESSTPAGSTMSSSDSLTGIAVAPRIGYAIRASDIVSIWPRAGVSYLHLSTSISGGTGGSANLLDATLEAPVAVTVAPRVVLLIGPKADISLYGKSSSDAGGPTENISLTDVGIQAGLLVMM